MSARNTCVWTMVRKFSFEAVITSEITVIYIKR